MAFASYLALMALAIHGLVLCWRDPRVWLIVTFTVVLTGISLLAFGLTRFRLPLLPFYCVLGGRSLVWLADRRRGKPDEA